MEPYADILDFAWTVASDWMGITWWSS